MKFLFLLIFCLVCLNGFCQDKGYISFSAGPSFPIANFESKDGKNSAAGFAKAAPVYNISVAYKLKNEFGIIALGRGASYATDQSAMVSEAERLFPGISWNVESGHWELNGLLGGIFGSSYLNEYVNFEFRALIGYLSATSPQLKFSGMDTRGNTAWVMQNSSNTKTFAYQLGAGFNFNLNKSFCTLVNVDYCSARPEFRNVNITTSKGENLKQTFSQRTETINLVLGLGLKF